MRRGVAALALIALIAFPAAAPSASATEFVVKPGGKNKVVFMSKAPIEAFEGKTNRLEGTLSVDPAAVGDSFTVHLEVDLASLDTGIAKRNQHMRENHLETAKYPKAVFDGASVLGPSGAKLEPGKTTTFDVAGTFSLHGVSRRIRIKAAATYTPAAGGTIAFETTFPVSLPDYNISRPQFLFMKLAETQTVRVAGVAVAAAAASR
jgi:polyisoprenoid-binding protein YceI